MKRAVIGLTGGIASGKTTVANMLEEFGYYVLDSDKIAHQAMHDSKIKKQIDETFGDIAFDSKGEVDRKFLGSVVFKDPIQLAKLNSIIHPYVYHHLEHMIASRHNAIVFVDVPLLFEAKFTTLTDKNIVVYAPKEIQIQRLMDRNDFTEEQALERIEAQMPIDEKRDLADFVVDNSGRLMDTRKQLLHMLPHIAE
ncbi:dephospho-CoA kinase [Culicoidibacter larvae]|uniref:Dephospho-CoA kinase n=1 Tax=Culicoidibacter larvae TaxID=2579976 RepID=A0A5R8QA14_9FIRM|nr:dephospho-CoA kinase [Culicoidibacter larvae]TLG72489.1 dephospho-CoA kinase [Culicoidibacter larvae]